MKPVGEFNQSRIVVEGDRVEHWLNGVKVLEYRLGSDDLRGRIANSKFRGINGYSEKRSGRFELQNHGDRLWIRNLKIRRLSPTP